MYTCIVLTVFTCLQYKSLGKGEIACKYFNFVVCKCFGFGPV